MAKSQETYSKKEKESKKLKKRQEKEEKKAERKASGKKSFEDMIAYVDEFGNLTDTPPDPKKKKELNLEDIQLGAKIEAAIDPADLIRRGNISFFNEEKGYGFIRDEKSQESIFFHVNGLTTPVKEKDKVSFETEMGQKGLNAIKVTVVV
ncbi:MAG: cold shock domain-containing protein [Bacteroidia bacterium]|nr:cold shock domain-containing protein [Bacteroidia bacterium]